MASVFNITPARSAQLPALIHLLLLGGKEELAHLSPLPFTMWSMMMKAVSQLSKYHHVQRACSLYKNVSDSGLHFSSDLYLSPFRWTHHGSFLFFPFSSRNPQMQLVRTCPWICSSSPAKVSWKRDGFFSGVQTWATLLFHFAIVSCFSLHRWEAKDTDYYYRLYWDWWGRSRWGTTKRTLRACWRDDGSVQQSSTEFPDKFPLKTQSPLMIYI